MGQVSNPPTPPSIILTSTDRLISRNAGGGVSPTASHIILLGENAGLNLGAVTGIIAMGANTFSAGISDVALAGSVVIGRNAQTGLVNTATSGRASPNVIIGVNALSLAAGGAGANVVIGARALADAVGGGGSNYSSNVVIGSESGEHLNFQNGSPFDNNVIIGERAARGTVAAHSAINCVIIGQGACENMALNTNNNVVVGQGAGLILSGSLNVIVGQGSSNNQSTGDENTVIGALTGVSSGANNSIFGARTGCTTGGDNTLLGNRIAAIQASSNSVIIGSRAGVFTGLTDISNQFLLDSVGQPLLYGRFDKGTLMIGTVAAADRAQLATINGTNQVFLANGTRGAGSPTGGGFLYGVAGELNWATTNGRNVPLTTQGSAVAALPAASAAQLGNRSFVTDAAAPTFGAVVAGGGAVVIPVFCNGVAWIVG